jgi:hypothetical protein
MIVNSKARTEPFDSASLTAVIDTGFNDYLSVPRRLLVGSKWLAIGTEKI